MKFKAKPMPFDHEPLGYDWLKEKMDDDGYVTGYYVDGYIVGDFAEVNNEYTHLEFWVPVLKDTLELVEVLEEEKQKYVVRTNLGTYLILDTSKREWDYTSIPPQDDDIQYAYKFDDRRVAEGIAKLVDGNVEDLEE